MATQEGKQEILDHLRQKCERSFGIAGWEKMRRNLEVTVVSPSTCEQHISLAYRFILRRGLIVPSSFSSLTEPSHSSHPHVVSSSPS